MTTAVPMLHCMEMLSKEFERAFVDLDLVLTDIEDDEFCDVPDSVKSYMLTMNSCFSQLCHKTQCIAQTNAKLEAQMLNIRTDYIDVSAKFETAKIEMEKLVRQCHAAQVQLHSLRKSSVDEAEDLDAIKKNLNDELSTFHKDTLSLTKAKTELKMLRKEQAQMIQYVANMETELYGSRLAAKYLDKELAGRIQQIQLLGRNVKPPNYKKMWGQLESEIHLHRHKTIVQACRKSNPPSASFKKEKYENDLGKTRKISIRKKDSEGLGINITGGKDHGIPILISEIHKNSVVDKLEEVYVGDAILSVNGIDLQNSTHAQAVSILSQKCKELELEVLSVAPENINEEEEVNFGVEMPDMNRIFETSANQTKTFLNDKKEDKNDKKDDDSEKSGDDAKNGIEASLSSALSTNSEVTESETE